MVLFSIPVKAVNYVTVVEYQPTSNNYFPLSTTFPSTNNSIGAVCETFRPDYNGYVYAVKVLLQKFSGSNADCFLGVRITTVNGTYGTNSTSSSSVIAYSDLVDSTTLGLSQTYLIPVTFNFTFTNGCPLFYGVEYALVLFAYNGTINDDNALLFGCYSTGEYSGDSSYQVNSQWDFTPQPTYDLCFTIYGYTGLIWGETPAPTGNDSGNAQATQTNTFITNVINVLFIGNTTTPLGLFLPLIIIIGFVLLFTKYAGAWGFIGGLNTSIVLCWLFGLFPLFAVVILVITDAVLIYGGNKVGMI